MINTNEGTVATLAAPPELPATVDAQGRLRVSKAQRRDILAALARSGESLPQFARRTRLKYSTLARWVQHDQTRQPKPSRRHRPLRLLEALIESGPNPATSGLVLHLPGGVRVEVADAKQAALAALVVRALSQPC
jgi:hypothetical protein